MGKLMVEKNELSNHKFIHARGSNVRTSFKNMRETSLAISGKKVSSARQTLKEVLDHRRCILFRRFTGGIGRTAQAHNDGGSNGQGRWPVKAAKILLHLLENAESNAEFEHVNMDELYVNHVLINRAGKQKRRTYRAHGRINPMNCTLCHIDIALGFTTAFDERRGNIMKKRGLRSTLRAFIQKSY